MARTLIELEEKEKLNTIIRGKDYIIYRLSCMQIGKNAEPKFLWDAFDEVLEARFFDEQEELHIYDFEGTYKASLFQEKEQDEYWEETHLIRERGMKEIKIRKYIAYDDGFGQAYVKETRPVHVI